MSHTVDQSTTAGRQRRHELWHERKRLLAFVKRTGSLGEHLTAVTGAVARLCPAVQACVLLEDERNEYFEGCYSAHLPAGFTHTARQLVLAESVGTTARRSACRAESVACESVATDLRWPLQWRWLCLEHGIRAWHFEPILGGGARVAASLMICLAAERGIDAWERQVARIACSAASIAIAQHRRSDC